MNLVHRTATAPTRASGDDVGRDLIFDEGDAIAQLQLPLLQALQHQEIRRRRLMQRINRSIEIAVLLLQTRKLGVEFALILIVHGCILADRQDEVVADEAARYFAEYRPWARAVQAGLVP